MGTFDRIIGRGAPAFDSSMQGAPSVAEANNVTVKLDAPAKPANPAVPVPTQVPQQEPTLKMMPTPKQVVVNIPALDSSLQGSPSSGKTVVAQETPAVMPKITELQQKGEKNTEAQNITEASKKRMVWDEMLKMFDNELSDKDKEKMEKKRRRDEMFAGVGDTISALSNLYFTTKGAPNSYDPSSSMSAKTKERWDRLNALREKDKEYRMNLLAKRYALAKDIENDDQVKAKLAEDKERWDKEFGLKEKAQTRLENEAQTRKLVGEARANQYKAMQAKNDAETDYYKAKAAALEAGYTLKQALIMAKIAKEESIADKNKRQGTSSWVSPTKSSTKSSAEFTATDANGKVYNFKSAKAAEQFARQNGTWQEGTVKTVKSDGVGTTKSTRTSGGYAKRPPKQKDNSKSFSNFSIHKK